MRAITLFLIAVTLPVGKDIFSTKSIEQRLVKVADGLYANKYETSNSEYRQFLYWAKEQNTDILEASEIHVDGWGNAVKEGNAKYYHEHQAFDDYPVVNITYEGAQHFCEWLTDKYNNNKKRKFQKVRFRLPTKDEWIAMAKNGRPYDMNYPWGGPYLKNKQGHYLANFYNIPDNALKVDINDRSKIEIARGPESLSVDQLDNYAFTSPVNSFMATGAGLHNLSGNVAEMLEEKGHTKGGSWGSSGYYIRIQAEDEFEGFTYSPYVGFRYVMEVIEE